MLRTRSYGYLSCLALLTLLMIPRSAAAQEAGILVVTVESESGPVAGAAVAAGTATGETDAAGVARLALPAGRVDVIVTHEGYDPAAAPVDIKAGAETRIEIDMQPQSEIEETVIVSATRSERRVEDEPLRVEVVPAEEVQEKVVMTPGDVSMLLAETNGLRVQTTSPSLGGASVRIQGLTGRYTQVLADGLPLYGGQSGSVGILQIPPMDLGQVEVIKGVASSLYGMSAIGGVVNLVSKRPTLDEPEREVLVNQTSHRGTDAALWIAQAINERWGVSLIGGTHWQQRSDLDDDGWNDLPMFRRVQLRPRLLWDSGAGRSVLVTVGGMDERRRGGTMPQANAPDGRPFAEHLDTTRIDGGTVGRFLLNETRIVSVRASVSSRQHRRRIGDVIERDRSVTWLGEASVTATSGRHTWVAGGAVQGDRFRAADVPRFNFSYITPGIFAQDDYALTPRVTVSGGVRLDVHNEFGAFVSPRAALLWRPNSVLTARLSTGRGHFAPVPFTDDTEATGLTPVAPLGVLEPEDASSVAGDLTWAFAPWEITATVFQSRIDRPLMFERLADGPYPARVVNAPEPTRTRGSELIGRYRKGGFIAILTHMYLWSTEFDHEIDRRAEVPLNPRHTATFDTMYEFGGTRVGFEAFYTGSQRLEETPYRTAGSPYVLWGVLFMQDIGRAVLFVNTENLGDVRQTKTEPLLFPTRQRDGRWATDAWAPLEGRTVNAGIRIRL
jgi:iron complex outermembrane receptor protein